MADATVALGMATPDTPVVRRMSGAYIWAPTIAWLLVMAFEQILLLVLIPREAPRTTLQDVAPVSLIFLVPSLVILAVLLANGVFLPASVWTSRQGIVIFDALGRKMQDWRWNQIVQIGTKRVYSNQGQGVRLILVGPTNQRVEISHRFVDFEGLMGEVQHRAIQATYLPSATDLPWVGRLPGTAAGHSEWETRLRRTASSTAETWTTAITRTVPMPSEGYVLAYLARPWSAGSNRAALTAGTERLPIHIEGANYGETGAAVRLSPLPGGTLPQIVAFIVRHPSGVRLDRPA